MTDFIFTSEPEIAAEPGGLLLIPTPAEKIIFCIRCGEKNPENNFRCTRCGQNLHFSEEHPYISTPTSDAAMRLLLPMGRSGWALAAGYLGLFSILLLPAPFAVVTGILAIRDIRQHTDKHGMGRAIFGIIAGVLGTIALLALALGRF